MTKSNDEILQEQIRKVDNSLADFAGGGILNDEQSDKFFEWIVDQPTIIPLMRTDIMGAPIKKIEKLGLNEQVLWPAVEGVALDPANFAKVSTGTVELISREFIAEARFSYQSLTDTIERGNINPGGPNNMAGTPTGGVKDTIMRRLAAGAAWNLEKYAITSALGGVFPYDQFDGVVELLNSNVHDQTTGAIDSAMVMAALKKIPTKYREPKSLLKMFVSSDQELNLREVFAQRGTAMGDAFTQNNVPVRVHGIDIVPAAALTDDVAILTNPQNMIMGMWKEVAVETEKLISTRQLKVVLTMRVAFAIEEETAAAKVINIG
jgi:hypothetical protein